MRFLVFSTEQDAASAILIIDQNGRQVFQLRGFEIVEGAVIGKRLSDDANMPGDCPTTTWDVPRQRLDGMWIISHPENQPGADTVIDASGTTAADFVMNGVTYDAVEEYDETWFPLPSRG